MVQLARAEVEGNPRADEAVRSFARIPLQDAESGCHQLFQTLGYCAPVKLEYLTEEGLTHIPYVRLSSWVQWLLDTNRLWRQFCGVSSWEKMQDVLGEFWSRYQALYPQHEVFTLPCDLRRTIPFYSHTDEGRTYKSKPIWVLSAHGCIGRGTNSYIRKRKHEMPLPRQQMGLNFVGNTYATHFLFATLVRHLMSHRPDALDILVGVFAADCEKLIHEGITSSDGTKHVYLLHLATKGDLPALSKLGSFERSFSHVPKAASSRSANVGICHYCLGGQESNNRGQEHVPYEDFSLQPRWLPTMYTTDPWSTEPTIFSGLPLDQSRRAQFFESDIWHNLHLGCLKHWVGASLVSVVERLVIGLLQGSVEAKFAWLTTEFKSFCRLRRMSPYLSEISRTTLNWPQSSSSPVGQWSKGQVSTQFCQFLEHFTTRYVVGQTGDPVLLSVVPLTGIKKL